MELDYKTSQNPWACWHHPCPDCHGSFRLSNVDCHRCWPCWPEDQASDSESGPYARGRSRWPRCHGSRLHERYRFQRFACGCGCDLESGSESDSESGYDLESDSDYASGCDPRDGRGRCFLMIGRDLEGDHGHCDCCCCHDGCAGWTVCLGTCGGDLDGGCTGCGGCCAGCQEGCGDR